jgi:hypothetical protein
MDWFSKSAVPACAWLRQALAINQFATGIVNSAPFAMLDGQRCMMLL